MKTILVVDDKSNVRTLIREYLTEEGFHIVTADNGRNALYEARHTKPDLVLLDIMMPEMDTGYPVDCSPGRGRQGARPGIGGG